jgi:hypothetical protein
MHTLALGDISIKTASSPNNFSFKNNYYPRARYLAKFKPDSDL